MPEVGTQIYVQHSGKRENIAARYTKNLKKEQQAFETSNSQTGIFRSGA
jgi:hypothetical protein